VNHNNEPNTTMVLTIYIFNKNQLGRISWGWEFQELA